MIASFTDTVTDHQLSDRNISNVGTCNFTQNINGQLLMTQRTNLISKEKKSPKKHAANPYKNGQKFQGPYYDVTWA